MSECHHELHEMDAACADGMCPMCLADQCESLRSRLAVEISKRKEAEQSAYAGAARLAEADALLREVLPSVQSHIRKHQRSWEAAMKRDDEFHTRKHCEQMNKDLALEARIAAHLARKP